MKKIFSVILSISLLVSILALPVSAAFDTAVPVQSQTSSIKYISDIYLFEEIFHANDSISLISSPTYEITYTQEISQGDKADTSHVSMDVLFNINGAEYSTYLEGDVTSKVLANGVTLTTYVDNVYDQGMDIFPPQAILFNQIDAEITSENPNCAIEDFYLVPDTEKYEGAEDDFSRTLLAICADIADFFGSSIPGSFQDLLESIIPEDYIAEVESDNYSHFRFTVDSLYDTVDFDETPFLFSYRITPGNTTSYPVHVTSRVRFMVMSEVSTWYFYSESTDFTAFPQFAVI